MDGDDSVLNLKAKIISHQDDQNILRQYIIFCKIFNEQRQLYSLIFRLRIGKGDSQAKKSNSLDKKDKISFSAPMNRCISLIEFLNKTE